MSNLHHERVLSVHHWTDTLFSFTTTRDLALLGFKEGSTTAPGDFVIEKALVEK